MSKGPVIPVVRTTLELPDQLFARLKARAALQRTTLKALMRSFVEEGLECHEHSGLVAKALVQDQRLGSTFIRALPRAP